MLLILIPVAWLAIATLFVALCRMAARADSELAPGAPGADAYRIDDAYPGGQRPVHQLRRATQHAAHATGSRSLAEGRLRRARPPLTAHGARARAARSAAES